MRPTASGTIEPGRLVAGRYLLLARVGRGGSGSVWRARDEVLNRDVAIKRLDGGSSLAAVHSQVIRVRAHREGRIAARLHHPRLAAIYDVIEHDGEVCLVMEYVAAPSLADLLARKGPLTAARVAAIGAQIAEGLAAMHRRGIVHRDVKPANIMVGPDDSVTITDFGIAIIDAEGDGGDHLVAGTPHYMAPELARGDAPTAAADVFSLGATLHAALEGSPPRGGAGVVRPIRVVGRLDSLLGALLDHEPQRRPSAATAARLLAKDSTARGTHGVVGRPSAERSAPSTSPKPAVVRALATDHRGDGQPAGAPDAGPASAPVGGRHRAGLAARRRPSRRAVAVGAGVAGVLGAAGFVALATAPDPTPPAASLAGGPVPAQQLPLAGPPIVPITPSTATSTPVEEVVSVAPPRTVTSRRATARPALPHRPDRAAPAEARGDDGGGDQGSHQGSHQGGDRGNGGNGNGNGRGHDD
jgi:hypothetical protein